MAGVRPAGVLDKVTRKEGFMLSPPLAPPTSTLPANLWCMALMDNPGKLLELVDFCHTREWPSDSVDAQAKGSP